jgi:hypothetical protein
MVDLTVEKMAELQVLLQVESKAAMMADKLVVKTVALTVSKLDENSVEY